MPSFLDNLPSRGNLTATVPGQSLYKAPQTYLAQHPTAPPEEQVITTDPENVLLRVLKLSQKREGPKGKADKAKAGDKSKRPAAEAAEGVPTSKRHNAQAATADGDAGSSRGAKGEKYTLQELQGKTNKALMDLLKDKGQSTKGKKEDLVKRIMDYQKREAIASQPH